MATRARNVADWGKVLAITRRHRVEGLVAHAIRRFDITTPTAPTNILKTRSRQILQRNLALAAETIRLHRLMDASGIPHLFVKGATLAQIAYGDQAVKEAIDVDMVVSPDTLQAAAAAIGEAGFRCVSPAGATGEQLLTWAAHFHESTWFHPDRGIALDLHWHLDYRSTLLPQLSADSATQQVQLAAGQSVPTLSSPDLFAYLCVHGAEHGWSRLKWLADLGAFINRIEPEVLARYVAGSESLRAGRAVGQALILCHDWLDLTIDRGLMDAARRRWANRLLAGIARRAAGGINETRESEATLTGNLPVQAGRLLLQPNLRSAVRRIGTIFVDPAAHMQRRYPRMLAWLYPVDVAVRVIARKASLLMSSRPS